MMDVLDGHGERRCTLRDKPHGMNVIDKQCVLTVSLMTMLAVQLLFPNTVIYDTDND